MRKKLPKKNETLITIEGGGEMYVTFWETKTNGIVITERPDGLKGYGLTHAPSGKRIYPKWISDKRSATNMAIALGQLEIDWTMDQRDLFDKYDANEVTQIIKSAAMIAGIYYA